MKNKKSLTLPTSDIFIIQDVLIILVLVFVLIVLVLLCFSTISTITLLTPWQFCEYNTTTFMRKRTMWILAVALAESDLDPQILFHTFIQSLAQLRPQQILQCPTLYISQPTALPVYFLNVKAWALIIDNEWMVHHTWIATVILWSCLCAPVNLGVVFLTAILPSRVSKAK